MDLLRDNPVLMREQRLYGRRWWGWVLFVLLTWVPLAYMMRVFLDFSGFLATTAWQETLFTAIYYVFRPDVLVGFYMVFRSTSSPSWHEVRQELGVTLLSPVQIIAGKALIPIVVLFALNALASPQRYFDLILGFGTDYTIPGSSFVVSTGAFIAVFALLEDVLFAVLVILIGMKEYCFRRDPFVATFRGLLQVGVIGLGLTLFSNLSIVVIPFRWYSRVRFDPAVILLVENGLFFLFTIPFEWLLMKAVARTIRRRMPAWLGREVT